MMTWNKIFFQSPSNYLLETVIFMHDMVIMFLSSIFIAIFTKFLSMLFLKSFNMEFFENHQIETIWTFVPFIILVAIAIPSLHALYMLDSCVYCGMTVSVTGHQWYWTYAMKQTELEEVNSYMVEESTFRLLETDNALTVPSSVPVKFLVNSSDVIHSWTIPSLGFKMDAIPGRINQFCANTKKSGVFYGQCSELCGSNHSFMPFVMESYIMEW